MVVVVCGLPGVGKTTVAKTIAERLKAEHLRTDDIRWELFSQPQFTPEEFQTVYDVFFQRAKTALQESDSVVLDASFKERANRGRARALAEEYHQKFTMVQVVCDEPTVKQRMTARSKQKREPPLWVYEKYKAEFEPVTEACITVDNRADIDLLDQTLQRYFP